MAADAAWVFDPVHQKRRTLIRTIGIVSLAVLVSQGAHAQPAPITQVRTHEGDCRRFDVDEKSGPRPGACKPEVAELIFADGFTSVQFVALDGNDKEIEKTAFIGPRWTQIDATHASMVIDQFMATRAPNYQLKPVRSSGFCLKTLKSENGSPAEPLSIVCEYNSSTSTHVFRLRDIRNSMSRSVQQ